MAKTEGTQNIPSELLDAYRATLGEQTPKTIVGKRYPYRVPTMQDGRGNVSEAQRTQRDRFLLAKENFAAVDETTRARWYAAMPPYSSFLWYYNYFIMSDLTGNADIKHGGSGVIKSIQFKTIAMPAGAGEGSVAITTIDPAKAVVMIYGNSYIFWSETSNGGLSIAFMTVYPYVSEITATLIKCKWSITNYWSKSTAAANIGITVIEYI